MNKKIKRDVTYVSIISGLLLVIGSLLIVINQKFNCVEDAKNFNSDTNLIHKAFGDSLKKIDTERVNRYDADRTETNKFFWSKAEADTIYFRKVRKLVKWKEIELSKIK